MTSPGSGSNGASWSHNTYDCHWFNGLKGVQAMCTHTHTCTCACAHAHVHMCMCVYTPSIPSIQAARENKSGTLGIPSAQTQNAMVPAPYISPLLIYFRSLILWRLDPRLLARPGQRTEKGLVGALINDSTL